MKKPIALEVEIPEETYVLLTSFIENNAPLGFNEVVSLAVSSFLNNQQAPLNSYQSCLSNIYDQASTSRQILEQ
ncbi:DUF2811 domain-containing protein [Crocosphaera sp. Alani8]|uniref:DUF2811 domain-containing protein n=1 Tax=Crocosphaera sp. Alani8 TaxID=3038952 RepID=UPI00313C7888